jgi:hypothetical protein
MRLSQKPILFAALAVLVLATAGPSATAQQFSAVARNFEDLKTAAGVITRYILAVDTSVAALRPADLVGPKGAGLRKDLEGLVKVLNGAAASKSMFSSAVASYVKVAEQSAGDEGRLWEAWNNMVVSEGSLNRALKQIDNAIGRLGGSAIAVDATGRQSLKEWAEKKSQIIQSLKILNPSWGSPDLVQLQGFVKMEDEMADALRRLSIKIEEKLQ